ncbi:hypothetical protein RF55_16681 [Lasius niger]|uniref:Uncharacterized protein n=1 Tax=Lasius niger TaxID=67767 RepID=A0A0J7K3P4_LASNI|nr:hypothetical protein RF55_16681 [Lasius niger]
MCCFKLREHLELHRDIEIPPEISSMGKSSSSRSMSLGSKKDVKDIPTSSGVPQAGSSKSSDTEVRDVDHDRDSRMEKGLKRKLSHLDQPDSSHFPDISDDNDRDSGMKRVKYNDNRGSLDELPSTSSNILDDGHTEGIATSNQCTEIEVLNVPTNVGSTEETNVSTLPTQDNINIGVD